MKTYDLRYILHVKEIINNSFFRVYVDGQLFDEIQITDHIVTFDVPSDRINDVKVELVSLPDRITFLYDQLESVSNEARKLGGALADKMIDIKNQIEHSVKKSVQQVSFNIVAVMLKQNFPMSWQDDKRGRFHFVYRPFCVNEINQHKEKNKMPAPEWLTHNILVHHEALKQPTAAQSWSWTSFHCNTVHDLSVQLQMLPDFTARETKWSYQNEKQFYYSYHVIILPPKIGSYAVCYHHKKQLVIKCFDSVEFNGDVFYFYKKNKKFPDITKKTVHAPQDIFYVQKIYNHEDFAKFLSQSCQFINTCEMRANKFRYEN